MSEIARQALLSLRQEMMPRTAKLLEHCPTHSLHLCGQSGCASSGQETWYNIPSKMGNWLALTLSNLAACAGLIPMATCGGLGTAIPASTTFALHLEQASPLPEALSLHLSREPTRPRCRPLAMRA